MIGACQGSGIVRYANGVILLLFRRAALGMKLYLAVLVFVLATTFRGSASNPQHSPASDREQYGLRGPVKSCVEETTYPARTAPDGRQFPEQTSWHETEYDPEGRILVSRDRTNDYVRADHFTYNAAAKLLKYATGGEGEAPYVINYIYDHQGRLTSMTDSSGPDNPVATFRYDEGGRKTELYPMRLHYGQKIFFAGSPPQVVTKPHKLQSEGTTVTTYDESDRPTEVQVLDGHGDLVKQTVRIYDEQGHLAEEILESWGSWAGDLREQLTKLMAGDQGMPSTSFTYDAQGRVKQTLRQISKHEDRIENTYNEQGDVASETKRTVRTGGAGDNLSSADSDVHYSYQYDTHGNWTEKITSVFSAPDGSFEPTTRNWRTLTYF